MWNRYNRFPLRISGGFFLLLLWFAASCGWAPLFTVLGAASVHEAGHILALSLLHCRITALRISVLGAVLETEQSALSYGKELIAVLAGPAANAAAAAVFAKAGMPVQAGANMVLCIYNLLPIRPLDGGRALELLLFWLLGPNAGEGITRSVSAVSALLGAVMLCGLMMESEGNIWLAAAAAGLFGISLGEMFGKHNFRQKNTCIPW